MTRSTHDDISPTSRLTAYLRTFAPDIPYATEIAMPCKAERTYRDIIESVDENPDDFLWLAPAMELRHKSIDAVLIKHSAMNILEIAAGFSPRGLAWTERDRQLTYLHTDLPLIVREMMQISRFDILQGVPRPNLLHLPLNALTKDHFVRAESFLGDGPVIVVTEGLVPYLDHDEKPVLAENILELIKVHSHVVWIATDIPTLDRVDRMLKLEPRISKVLEAVTGLTNRDLQANAFANAADAMRSFIDWGFDSTVLKSRELVPTLTSIGKVAADEQKLNAMLNMGEVWVMEPR